MNAWQIILLIIAAYIAIGAGVFIWLGNAEQKYLISALWPLVALWMLIMSFKS